jgi:predicted CoA-binding protein
MKELKTGEELRQALAAAKTIAVLGANPKPNRPAHYVPLYLKSHGYRVIPVNAVHTDKELFGEPVRGRLDEIGEAVDIVDVFRRPDALDGHLDEILAMSPRPGIVWLQEGIRNDGFAGRLMEQGIQVVQDRCIKAQHARLIRK